MLKGQIFTKYLNFLDKNINSITSLVDPKSAFNHS